MSSRYNASQHHSIIEVEHRFTVLEAIKDSHGKRIMALERKVDLLQKKPSWTPRDWILSAAGIGMVFLALAEKIGWTTALAAFVKIYGLK